MKPQKDPQDWPRLRVWLRDFENPADAIDTRQGRWIESAPVADVTKPENLYLSGSALSQTPSSKTATWSIPADLHVGQAAGDTGYFGRHGGLPLDQAQDDQRSLIFDTPPLSKDMVLYGGARIDLTLTPKARRSQISIRLNDVAPDGTVARVTYALRNLDLNDDLDAAPPTQGTDPKRVSVPLHTTAYRFRKGHRIRLSLAQSYWPLVWTPPSFEEVTLHSGQLTLPVFDGHPSDLQSHLPPAEDLPKKKEHTLRANPALRRFQQVTGAGDLQNGWHQPFTEVYFPDIDTAFGFETTAEHSVTPTNPASARTHLSHQTRYTRADGVANIQSALTARCHPKGLHLEGHVSVTWNNEEFAKRSWNVVVAMA